MKIIKTLSACMALGLVGCGTSAPSCNDDSVKELVLQITNDEVGQQLGMQLGFILAQQGIQFDVSKLKVNLDAIRTLDQNDKSKKVSCAANVQAIHGGKTYLEQPVIYTAQPTDDGKSVWVEVEFR